MKSKFIRSLFAITIILFVGSLVTLSSTANTQISSHDQMVIGDYIKYSFTATGAFIPYADQALFLEVQNISDPDDILVNVLYGSEDFDKATFLNMGASAGWYILNNYSLQTDWQTCPLHNISNSKISEYWVLPNISNVTVTSDDVDRSAIELDYSYSAVLHGDNYNVSVQYIWDYHTGILISNTLDFTHELDYSLSGTYEQVLVETTVWESSTKAIPGFPLVWLLSFFGFAVMVLIILVQRKKPINLSLFSNRTIIIAKFLIIISIFLSSSYLLLPNIVPSGLAASDRTMPGANVLLLTNNSECALATSLGLDDTISFTTYLEGQNSTEDLLTLNYSKYDVIISDGYLPTNDTALHKLKSAINGTESDIGLIFFGGNYNETTLLVFDSLLPVEFVIDKGTLNSTLIEFYNEQSGLSSLATSDFYAELYAQTNTFEIRDNDIQLTVSDEQESLSETEQSMYVKRIAWESTPLLRERLLTYAKKPSATMLIEVPDTKEPLVVTWEHDWNADNISSQVIYISAGVETFWNYEDGEIEDWNTPFRLWPYFNYFLYLMVYDIKGLNPEEIESYADWPWSPIPHQREAIIWMVFVGSLWVFNFTLFFVLRRKSKKRDLAKSDSSLNLENTQNEDTKEENSHKPS